MRTSSRCRKKKNEYCRIHNPEPKGFTESTRQEFIRKALMAHKMRTAQGKKPLCKSEAEILNQEEAKKRAAVEAEKREIHQYRVDDMEKHMKLKVDPKTGVKTVSVFRAGVPETPNERGVEKDAYLASDIHLPEGRQGRMSAIFASPTLHGVNAWVRGVSNVVKDWGVRELRVNPDKVYAYSVRAWENASSYDANAEKHAADWASGITLTQWYEKLKNDPDLEPQGWELLLSKEDVQAVKPVGAERVARSTYPNQKGEVDKYMLNLLTKQLGRK